MRETVNISVLGAGSWGTAIANLLAKKGYEVTLWVRNKELLKDIERKRENEAYLKGIKIHGSIKLENDLRRAVPNKSVIVIAIPVVFLREMLGSVDSKVDSYVVSLSKGIETETFLTATEIIKDILGIEDSKIAALSGPNFALEVAKGLPTATVLASCNLETAKFLQTAFSTSRFRVYTSRDVKGVELCGAMKNVMAIASGISDGLNLGLNARASLITRGLSETIRLGSLFGAKKETFMGLSGIGDLVLTCTGDLSRNRTVGLEIARGKNIRDILYKMKMVPEGINTTKAVYEYSLKNNIDLPITKEVYNVIYKGKNPMEALDALMNRPLKEENYLL